MSVIEIVKWKGKEAVSDQSIIEAVDEMVPDLQNLDGFISQTLYKDSNDYWIDVYYWDNVENAHSSNEKMAGKGSLIKLLELINLESMSIEVMESLQKSK